MSNAILRNYTTISGAYVGVSLMVDHVDRRGHMCVLMIHSDMKLDILCYIMAY